LTFSEEISRQLNNSNAQVLFGLACMSPILQQAVAMTKRSIKIVYAKDPSEAMPSGGIDLAELISTKGEKIIFCLQFLWIFS
jgi:hypothetical protein